MDSPFMQAFAEGLATRGLNAARFEFPYMAERRTNGTKKPPNRAPVVTLAIKRPRQNLVMPLL